MSDKAPDVSTGVWVARCAGRSVLLVAAAPAAATVCDIRRGGTLRGALAARLHLYMGVYQVKRARRPRT